MSTFTFRIDDELKSVFAETAKGQDRTSAQLLRVLMRREIEADKTRKEHDAWFRREVEDGLLEADDPGLSRLSDEEVRSDWHEQRARLLKEKERGAA